jgi:hypothetical protein
MYGLAMRQHPLSLQGTNRASTPPLQLPLLLAHTFGHKPRALGAMNQMLLDAVRYTGWRDAVQVAFEQCAIRVRFQLNNDALDSSGAVSERSNQAPSYG